MQYRVDHYLPKAFEAIVNVNVEGKVFITSGEIPNLDKPEPNRKNA